MTRKTNNEKKIFLQMSIGSFAGAAALGYSAFKFMCARLFINLQIFVVWFFRNLFGWSPVDVEALNNLRESSIYAEWLTDLPRLLILLVWFLEIFVFVLLIWLGLQSLKSSVVFFLKARKK